ncbi:MAG: sulfatase [Porphyromonadaceae bacterium CG2_30_38_12]|nr:MAG: sulfatase [Porphyromonadaceae bacterium CG2_30_38_12]
MNKIKNFSFVFTAASALQLQAQPKPNIVFFLADDLGWTDLACYGSKFYETPNIDQLAREGMLFTDAYAACPVSSPTRAAFQTGRYPARVGVTDWIKGHQYEKNYMEKITKLCPVLPAENLFNLPLSEITIAEALKTNGYKTAHIGKWHLAIDSIMFPQYQGYGINIAGCAKGSPVSEGGGSYFTPYNNPYLSDGLIGEYLTDRLGDECVKIIQKYKDSPFFISFPFYQVHAPLLAKPDKEKYFKEKAHRMGLDTLQAFNNHPAWAAKEDIKANYRERIVQNNATYAAMIASMDENVGKVIAELKRLGLYENTLIVFTSDNGGVSTGEGYATSNLPLKGGKGFMYEGGIREPLIAVWKNHIASGVKSKTVVSTVDFYPTFLEVTKTTKPNDATLDGQSILPALQGKKQNRGAIYWHYPHYHPLGARPASAIRKGDYKLIEFLDNGDVELYNLRKDSSETNNLAISNRKLAVKMLAQLKHWRASVRAKMPTKNIK